jgi:hypothetical protein
MRTGVLITGLVLLLVANLLAFYGFQGKVSREGFTTYFLQNAGELNGKPMGPFDGVRLETGNGVSSYRYNHPNEPLAGNYPPFTLGMDSLFMFRDNQVKPECCSASYSGDGTGCVCTTPQQRTFLNQRGGNRTVEDGF